MTEPLRLFVLAGEPSGDRIAADLVERLRARTDVELSGVGGTELEAAGLRSMFPMAELSVMGWADVLPRLPKLLWRTRQVARAIVMRRASNDRASSADGAAAAAAAAVAEPSDGGQAEAGAHRQQGPAVRAGAPAAEPAAGEAIAARWGAGRAAGRRATGSRSAWASRASR